MAPITPHINTNNTPQATRSLAGNSSESSVKKARLSVDTSMTNATESGHMQKLSLQESVSDQSLFNLPSLVHTLSQSVEASLVTHEPNQFTLEPDLAPLQITAQIKSAYEVACTAFKCFISNHATINNERKKETVSQLTEGKPFIVYGLKMSEEWHNALPTIKSIINILRAVNREVQDLKTTDLEEILNVFPLKQSELQCFDGSLTRLEAILSIIKHKQIIEGTRAPISVLQHLKQSAMSQPQLLHHIIEATIDHSNVKYFISRGQEIHRNIGYQYRLGIDPGVVEQKDVFAQVAVQRIPGGFFYDSILIFQSFLQQFLCQELVDSDTIQTLDEFQKLLIAVPKSIAHDNFTPALLKLNQSPLKKLLCPPERTLEQNFGAWNDNYTELEGWKLSEIKRILMQSVRNEWCITTRTDTTETKLEGLSFSEVCHNIKDADIHRALTGDIGPQEQYLAAQYLYSLSYQFNQDIDIDTPFLPPLFRTKLFMVITKGLTPGTGDEKFSEVAQSILSQYGQDNSINKRIIDRICKEIPSMYSQQFPYCNASINLILSSYVKLQQKMPMSSREFTLLLDNVSDLYLDAQAHERILWQPAAHDIDIADLNSDVWAMEQLVSYATKNPSLRVALFLRNMTLNNLGVLNQSLIMAISNPAIDPIEFLTRGLGLYFPEMLKDDHLHRLYPHIATVLFLRGLDSVDVTLIKNLLYSDVAKSRIREILFETQAFTDSFCQQYNALINTSELSEYLRPLLFLD